MQRRRVEEELWGKPLIKKRLVQEQFVERLDQKQRRRS
jgi:hypothetical protein